MLLNSQSLILAFDSLKSDMVLRFLIEKFSSEINIKERFDSNYSKALSELIIEQQISFKAAIKIKERFNLFISSKNNKEIANLDSSEIRSIGISNKKADYIKNVYNHFLNDEFDFDSSSEDEIINHLIEIKGVGKWTVEMFMMFVLMRIDIFSFGDLALIKSISLNYGIESDQITEIKKLTDSWAPYKTVASLLLWKSVEEKIFYE
tara:strand:+ start:666 stop:1283 length:618 start_codon:yes stop_codon:yes gene_type:complete